MLKSLRKHSFLIEDVEEGSRKVEADMRRLARQRDAAIVEQRQQVAEQIKLVALLTSVHHYGAEDAVAEAYASIFSMSAGRTRLGEGAREDRDRHCSEISFRHGGASA